MCAFSFMFTLQFHENLLPCDGELFYLPNFLDKTDAFEKFKLLDEEIAWSNEVVTLFGKPIQLSRKVAFYGNKGLTYKYSGRLKFAIDWTSNLEQIKMFIESHTGESFNACLLNYYHNGTEGMGWHSDNEKELVENAAIASLSLGDSRDFVLKHKITGRNVRIHLENGSLLIMKGAIQKHWLHALPKTKKSKQPRINLTFRLMKT
jgi:alkylated DNA repair dioxygenase AlkB